MAIEVPLSLAGTQEWFSRTAVDPGRRDFAMFRGGQDAEPVAMGGLTDIERKAGHAELYIVVAPTSHGGGIGTEAIKWLCAFGFRDLSLNKIYLHTLASNDRARRLYERLGFVHEGTLREHLLHRGALVDRHIQSLLVSEWRRQPWAGAAESR
jgi:RimJ/RimL family protein N-acetyltransferase